VTRDNIRAISLELQDRENLVVKGRGVDQELDRL